MIKEGRIIIIILIFKILRLAYKCINRCKNPLNDLNKYVNIFTFSVNSLLS